MSAYRQLLVAIDLGEESRAVAAKSAELARLWQARLQLLHVIEFVPVEPMSDALVPVVQIDDRLIARAREQLAALAVDPQVGKDHAAVFELESPTGFDNGTVLTFTLAFKNNTGHAIGRPRFVRNPYRIFLIRREAENRIGAFENVVGLVREVQIHGSASSLDTCRRVPS